MDPKVDAKPLTMKRKARISNGFSAFLVRNTFKILPKYGNWKARGMLNHLQIDAKGSVFEVGGLILVSAFSSIKAAVQSIVGRRSEHLFGAVYYKSMCIIVYIKLCLLFYSILL